MKKRILSALLAFTMIFSTSAAVSAEDIAEYSESSYSAYNSSWTECEEYFDDDGEPVYLYRVLSDGTISIKLNNYAFFEDTTYLYTPFVIPSTIDGKTVTEIEEYAFQSDQNSLDDFMYRQIELPDTVRKIGYHAFDCYSMKYITIPDSVTQIEEITSHRNGLIIRCNSGSYARQYAKDNGFEYRAINAEYIPAKAIYRDSKKYIDRASVYFEKDVMEGTDGYRVFFFNESTNSWQRVNNFVQGTGYDSKNLYYTRTGLKPGHEYKFMIKNYVKKNGKTYWGPQHIICVATKPNRVKVTKVNKTSTAIRFTWNTDSNATGYRVVQYIENSWGGGSWKTVAHIPDNTVNTVRLTGFKPNTTYKFMVQAYKQPSDEQNFNSESAFSPSSAITVTTKK